MDSEQPPLAHLVIVVHLTARAVNDTTPVEDAGQCGVIAGFGRHEADAPARDADDVIPALVWLDRQSAGDDARATVGTPPAVAAKRVRRAVSD